MNGYDFDGVITAGVRPEGNSVIITGRPESEKPQTMDMLKSMGINAPVYFNPSPRTNDPEHYKTAAEHKANMIQQLGVKNFYEDERRQAEIIQKKVPNINLMIVQ